MKEFFIVKKTDEIRINHIRPKGRRDLPWAVVPNRIFSDYEHDKELYGLFTEKKIAQTFATLLNVQERITGE